MCTLCEAIIKFTAMKNLPLVLLLLGSLSFSQAQEAEQSIEHPIFKSIPGFTLNDHKKKDFAAYRFCDINGDDYIVEGQVSYYYYECDGSVDPTIILKRFEETGDKLNAEIYGDGKHQLYMVLHHNNRRIYVDLFAEDFYYILNLVERGELKSEISDEDLLKDLHQIGKAVLYFNFKHNECELTSDCDEIIDMIADALKDEPAMCISIDAYTDNIGFREDNLELSAKRAKIIHNALMERGIDSLRMIYNGFGEKDPIADNNTVMGRAFNNRIEIVKK